MVSISDQRTDPVAAIRRYNPEFAPIRSDPRFQELMRQQEAWAKAQPDPVDL